MRLRTIGPAIGLIAGVVTLITCTYCQPQGAHAQEDCPPTYTPTPTPLPTPTAPSAVAHVDFSAQGNTVTWETGIEINTVSFNIWRKVEGSDSYVKANADPIMPKGMGGPTGDVYTFVDEVACEATACQYKLEEREVGDGSRWYGPVSNGITEVASVTVAHAWVKQPSIDASGAALTLAAFIVFIVVGLAALRAAKLI